MEREELIQKFKGKFGKNFMTPDVIAFNVKGNTVIELSSGRGMEPSTTIYGVTVRQLLYDDNWQNPDLSKPFNRKEDAVSYIEKLKEVV